ncbi:MAG: EAL domain-containing protein [Methylobacter sp.]|nr:EAL domain-containing protein [Candidatus Methylobacter titanis]
MLTNQSGVTDAKTAAILFVDDEANVLKALGRLFHNTGYMTYFAASGAEGLEILQQNAVDLIISDMRMPEMDGAEFLTRIFMQWPETIRILLTGYADFQSTIDAVNKGRIYNYCNKPWNDQELKLLVHNALEQKRLREDRDRLSGIVHQQNKELKGLNEYLSFYDQLTGLANRRLLYDRIKQALALSVRSGRMGALLFIDLDNFKTLNDTIGHDVGDLLLQKIAQRLQSCVREGDTIARLSGDEFVVMLENLSKQDLEAAAQAEAIGNKILNIINQPYQLTSHDYHCTASIGIAFFNDHNQSKEELLKHADIARYQAKTAGRNTLCFFDPQVQANLIFRVALEIDLRLALAENQFKLYYQAQVHQKDKIIGAEVLIRWHHPQRGVVSPIDFIPLAEETGLILLIGHWVLETACAQIKKWGNNCQTQHLQLAVNVSAKQFGQANFVEQVCQILRRSAINPERLKLELTESLVLYDIDNTILKMKALREIGVRFSMDDFGTGYSSLAYLTQLPLDQLKIDQSFVRNINVKTSDAVIVQTIIGMGNNLGIEVIAEGVETEGQRYFLEQNNCSIYQGYLFSKPVLIEQFESLLKQK